MRLVEEFNKNGQTSEMLSDTRQVVIVHSMMRTSTTSMGKALVILGMGSEDHGWRPDLGSKYQADISAVNTLLHDTKSIYELSDEKKLAIRLILFRLVTEIQNYWIFSDFPVGHTRIHPVAKKLLFPNAKFIWIDREMGSWIKSVRSWQLGHQEVFKNAKSIWEDQDKASNNLVNSYNKEKQKILNLKNDFPDDVLITDIESGWESLCAFLGCETPSVDFPHINESVKGGLR